MKIIRTPQELDELDPLTVVGVLSEESKYDHVYLANQIQRSHDLTVVALASGEQLRAARDLVLPDLVSDED